MTKEQERVAAIAICPVTVVLYVRCTSVAPIVETAWRWAKAVLGDSLNKVG